MCPRIGHFPGGAVGAKTPGGWLARIFHGGYEMRRSSSAADKNNPRDSDKLRQAPNLEQSVAPGQTGLGSGENLMSGLGE